LRQLARHTGLGRVREEGGAESGGDADEHEHTEAPSVLLLLLVDATRLVLGVLLAHDRCWELQVAATRLVVTVHLLDKHYSPVGDGRVDVTDLCEVRLGKGWGWDR